MASKRKGSSKARTEKPAPKSYRRTAIIATTAVAIVLLLMAFMVTLGQGLVNNLQLTSQPTSNTSTSQQHGAVYGLISESQAASLVGSGGSYNVLVANATELAQYPPNALVTAAYGMQYDVSTGSSPALVQEIITDSNNATIMYNNSKTGLLNLTTQAQGQGAVGINATKDANSNGLLYTEVSYIIPHSNITSGGSVGVLVGQKGDRFVSFFFQIANSTKEINASTLGAALSGPIS
jgi:hypothetical protein